MFKIISGKNVAEVVQGNGQKILSLVQSAYKNHANKTMHNPPSYFLRFPDLPRSRIIALPSSSSNNPRVAGVKWISSNPDNHAKGLKRASAVLVLNDYDTGYPIACIESGLISALRTVYSAVAVANCIKPDKRIKSLGLLGCGYIAQNFLQALLDQEYVIEKIFVCDFSQENAEVLRKKFSELDIQGASAEQAVQSSDVIFLATTAGTPYLCDPKLFRHNPLVLNISLRDIGPDVLISAYNIVDDVEHVLNAGTAPHLAEQKYGHRNFITCTAAELIENGADLVGSDKPIIFSPMGMGVLDLVIGDWVYREAESLVVENFFEN
jgi:2,3-diaminopropionate biosynthesis protein SbnB